jgi:hypothetical protein
VWGAVRIFSMNSPSSFSNTKDPDYEKQKQEEKLLVAEQPGFSYGLLAIFIALLLGFSWRAFFSPFLSFFFLFFCVYK